MPALRAVLAVLLSLFCLTGIVWAQPCDPWCGNSDTFNPTGSTTGSYWVGRKNPSNSITIYVNGTVPSPLIIPQPGHPPNVGIVSKPALESFDGKIILAVRGSDSKVWANSWNGVNWDGWVAYMTPLFAASPDMAVVNNILVVAAVGASGSVGMWVTRSVALAQGFEPWRLLGGNFSSVYDALACSNTSQIRVGATVGNSCVRKSSADGLNWTTSWETFRPVCP